MGHVMIVITIKVGGVVGIITRYQIDSTAVVVGNTIILLIDSTAVVVGDMVVGGIILLVNLTAVG